MLNQCRYYGMAGVFLIALTPFQSNAQQDSSPDPQSVFADRIMPIFRSEKPSSCVQCHLASVDLKDYIRPSSEQTFVSLRDQGMIDLENPSQSKILELIRMGEDDFDRGARLIHEKMRKQEYEAFSSWIVACCKDKNLVGLPKGKPEEQATPEVPNPVIRHGRKGRLLNSFVRNIWSQRLRCFPCHTPNDIKPGQVKIQERFDKFKAEYGEKMVLFRKTPLQTMNNWLSRTKVSRKDAEQGNLPLINLDDPKSSLIVLKPTAKLPPRNDGKFDDPSCKIPVSHMGGLKMHVNDPSYKAFVSWIKDYSKLKSGDYQSADDLPQDNWYPTKKVLRLKEVPESWGQGTTVQMQVFEWNSDAKDWGRQPTAFTQGTITPRHMVNGALFLLAPTNPEQKTRWVEKPNRLPPGKYLIKVMVDHKKQINQSPEILLDVSSSSGQIILNEAKWRAGFPKAEVVSAKDLTHHSTKTVNELKSK